ncbi:MAG: type II toxin-antitoxin system VapC family toxin [Bacteroidota bacterium]
MIVVDTNIIAHATFKTAYTSNVLKVHQKDPMWVAPILWKSEFLNVVSLHLRKNLINLEQAFEAYETASNFIGSNDQLVSPYDVIERINNASCSSYDCEFVELAERMNTSLITYDKKILSEFPSIAMKPEDYLAQAL